jgi:hypothetical protein
MMPAVYYWTNSTRERETIMFEQMTTATVWLRQLALLTVLPNAGQLLSGEEERKQL